jgi:hypothetical protein
MPIHITSAEPGYWDVTFECRRGCGRTITVHRKFGPGQVPALSNAAFTVHRRDQWGTAADYADIDVCRQCLLTDSGWQAAPGPDQSGGDSQLDDAIQANLDAIHEAIDAQLTPGRMSRFKRAFSEGYRRLLGDLRAGYYQDRDELFGGRR